MLLLQIVVLDQRASCLVNQIIYKGFHVKVLQFRPCRLFCWLGIKLPPSKGLGLPQLKVHLIRPLGVGL